MNENFKKLKTKAVLLAVLKSLIVGISIGLVIVGIVLLALKSNAVSINIGFYVLIAFSVAILCGGGFLLYIFPTTQKFAKTLDKEYSLNEKIQTMVAYQNSEGTIVALQRADAENCLATLPKKKPSIVRICCYLACVVFMLAIFIPAVVVPAFALSGGTENEKPNDDTKFVYSEYMSSSLEDLIEDVRASSCQENVKNSVINKIENLGESLTTITLNSQMETAVIAAIKDINKIMYSATSYSAISGKLTDTAYSRSILVGVCAYKSSGFKFTSFEQVKTFESSAARVIISDIMPTLNEAKEKLVKGLSDNTVDFASLLTGQISLIRTALGECGVDTDDDLYKAFWTYSNNLTQVRRDAESGKASADLQNEINEVISNLSEDMTDALSKQSYECAMELYIRQRLLAIFNIKSKLPDLVEPTAPENSGSNNNQSSGDDDDNKVGSGGYGTGDMTYGSGDYIYSPDYYDEENETYGGYVKYGDALADKYYAEVLALLESGNYSEETAAAIREYFEILYSGVNDNTGN